MTRRSRREIEHALDGIEQGDAAGEDIHTAAPFVSYGADAAAPFADVPAGWSVTTTTPTAGATFHVLGRDDEDTAEGGAGDDEAEADDGSP